MAGDRDAGALRPGRVAYQHGLLAALIRPIFNADSQAHLRSTNPLERVNKEVDRRTDVVGIFPDDQSLIRLAGMLCIEQSLGGCGGPSSSRRTLDAFDHTASSSEENSCSISASTGERDARVGARSMTATR